MEAEDQCEVSPNRSLNSKRVLCLTIFWIIFTIIIIMAGATLLLAALGMLGLTGIAVKSVDAVRKAH